MESDDITRLLAFLLSFSIIAFGLWIINRRHPLTNPGIDRNLISVVGLVFGIGVIPFLVAISEIHEEAVVALISAGLGFAGRGLTEKTPKSD